MSSISNPTQAALSPRARSLDDSVPASRVGRLPSQRTIAYPIAGGVNNGLTPTGAVAPVHASSAPKRNIRLLRVVTGCTLGAVIGVLIGGPIGIVVGALVGSAYVMIGPHAMAQVIRRAALMAYQHIQDYRASHKPAASV